MARGTLRIYLGAAPGVGKTFAMLNEGWRRKERGTDVVVGYVETHGRPSTEEQLRDLEIVPRKTLAYRDAAFEEMDVDAILARRPQVALVDELAHTNVPGSRNEKRWQDINELLDAGISVISTVNIQHLESVNDVVERITGIKQRETVPDEVVRAADQVELQDMTPEALRRRLAHGNVYQADKIDAALANYFRPGNLNALRELALLWVADRVEENLQSYMDAHGISDAWETRERVLVAIKGSRHDEQLIRRGARMASRSRGDLVVVFVRSGEGLEAAAPAQIERDRSLVAELGGELREIIGEDVAKALVRFARSEKATQLVMGETHHSRLSEFVRGSVINKTIRLSGHVDVHVISFDVREDAEPDAPLPRVRRRVVMPLNRLAWGWASAVVAPAVLTALLTRFRAGLGPSAVLLLFLLVVVAVAWVGGTWPALAAAIATSLLVNYSFIEPLHRFAISDPQNLVALAVFVIVAAAMSTAVSRLARRTNEARRARAEAEIIARAAGTLVGHDDPVKALLEHVRSAFDVDAVTVLRRRDNRWQVEASAGEPVVRPEYGDAVTDLGGDARLVVTGRTLGADDRRVLESFGTQLVVALESNRLRSEASAAEELAAGNVLRTALLAAVSHDLRTPLASIKASATSLLQGDVDWTREATQEFLRTIVDEADRLNTLVGNLLDMSRLQAGGLHLSLRSVGVDEVVAAALSSLGDRASDVVVDVPDTLPTVLVDPALLERAVANIADNALTYSPPGEIVKVRAGEIGDRILLRVVDRGPGIPPEQREEAFRPFQRFGDSSAGGVGLGLAVARGFVEAMGGQLVLDDTAGGGLTVVIDLKAEPR